MNKIKLTLVIISILSFDCKADFWRKMGNVLEQAAVVATEREVSYKLPKVKACRAITPDFGEN
jgi:hypothetical protein